MTEDTQITSKIASDIAWARHHLFLLGAVVILTVGSIYGIETLLANRAHEAFIQQQTLLKQVTDANALVQADTKAQIAELAKENSALQQQVATLASAIATRDAQLIKDRQQIKTLPPDQLATKWGAAANEPAPIIDSNGNFDAPLPLAQKSVDALIQVPVLTKDRTDLQAQLGQEQIIATNNQVKFEQEQKAHDSDNATCKQTLVTKDAQIKDMKAKARKRNILIAIFGTALGFGLHR